MRTEARGIELQVDASHLMWRWEMGSLQNQDKHS